MLQSMLRITILLKVDGTAVQIMIVEGAGEWFGEYIHIEEAIHDPVDPVKFPNTILGDAPPHHNTPITMLHLLVDICGIISMPWPPPAPVPAIRTKNIEFG